MNLDLNIPVLISLGGVVASLASAVAVSKVKTDDLNRHMDAHLQEFVSARSKLEKEIIDLREEYTSARSNEATKIALLEQNQVFHEKELQGIKADIKTIMNNVQEIKEAVIKVKKGNQ